MSRRSVSSTVSVIVPAYNSSGTIIDALDSVYSQGHRPIELIVVDDGSTDDTADLVNAWASKKADENFTVKYVSQPNAGLSSARNKGFGVSGGEFIQFLDSDDVIHQDKFSKSISSLTEAGADIAVCQVMRFSDGESMEEARRGEPEYCPYSYRPEDPPYLARIRWDAQIPLYRRAVVEEIGPFKRSLPICQGYDWVCRCRCLGKKTCFLPHRLYFYRQGVDGSLTSSSRAKMVRDRIRVAWHIGKTLERHRIKEPKEWREISLYSLRTSYSAQALGLDDAARLGYLFARRLSRRAPLLHFISLQLPWFLVRSAMKLRYAMRDKTRRD